MKINAMVTGVYNASVPVIVEPHDSITTLFRLLEKRLFASNLSSTFTAAYAMVPGISGDHPDYFGLRQGDPGTVAQYLTPATRIDPTNSKKKTVRDYLGDHVVHNTISIMLTWPLHLMLEEKQKRERGRISTEVYLAVHPTSRVFPSVHTLPQAVEAAARSTAAQQAAVRGAEANSPRTMAASSSPWQWLSSSCWPFAS